MKFNELGRSMVEMLGVLAIIGVLSVGAIAGYSKAMRKYRLNQLTEQLNTVINASARYAKSFINLTNVTYVTNYLIKLGEIPENMIKDSDTDYIYDIFGNQISIRHQPQTSENNVISNVTSLFYYISLTDNKGDNLDICQTVFNIAKEHRDDIYYIYLASGSQTDDARVDSFYGNSYCSSEKKCLKDININTISEACLQHSGSQYSSKIVLLWKH